jgi:hypothetical protein
MQANIMIENECYQMRHTIVGIANIICMQATSISTAVLLLYVLSVQLAVSTTAGYIIYICFQSISSFHLRIANEYLAKPKPLEK